MASIDRYRPPREGYQPPSLPPKPPRPSRSPSSRRDVPPAVPSPPTHSSRTSSLPPQSRRVAPSPAHPSPTSASRPRASQWFFTPDEALSTPSIIDGLAPGDERLRRAKGVNFIYQAGAMIELPQTTLWVGAVFFHRFYMRFSMVEEKGGVHHYVCQHFLGSTWLGHHNAGCWFRPGIHRLIPIIIEYRSHGPISSEQDRRKLSKNERPDLCRCESCTKEPETHR